VTCGRQKPNHRDLTVERVARCRRRPLTVRLVVEKITDEELEEAEGLRARMAKEPPSATGWS